MSENVLTPLPGTVIALSEVPDPVFAQEIVGGGLAVRPRGGAGPVDAAAPLSGVLVRVQPHAFVIQSDAGTGILVHIGIDTVHMNGAGFDVLATEGTRVVAGQAVVRFDPTVIAAHGYSDICPVIVLQSPAGAVPPPRDPREVTASDTLFSWPG